MAARISAGVGLAAMVLLGSFALAEPVQAEASVERIGRYEVSQGAEGLELSRRTTGRGGTVALVLGVALLLGAGALVTTGGLPSAVVGGIGVVLLGFAAWVSLDRAVWRANEVTLSREGFAGRTTRWRAADIAQVELEERTPRGAELKQSVQYRWMVRVRLADGDSAGPGLSFVAHDEAERAANALAEALAKPRGQRARTR